MSNVWFTADLHLGHDNIIRYCKRPFADHVEMDAAILERFNSRIRRGDELYILGDVAWSTYPLAEFFDHLNTKQVHLIWGNHDTKRLKTVPSIRSFNDLKNVHIGRGRAVLCHYAMQTWSGKGRGVYHLFGHSHGMLPGVGRSMDVGVDTNDFYPYSWEEIDARLSQIPYLEYD